jgi:hypothetical protein
LQGGPRAARAIPGSRYRLDIEDVHATFLVDVLGGVIFAVLRDDGRHDEKETHKDEGSQTGQKALLEGGKAVLGSTPVSCLMKGPCPREVQPARVYWSV